MAEFSAYDRREFARSNPLTMEELAFAPLGLTEEHNQIEEQLHYTMSESQKAELAAMQDPNSKAAQKYQGHIAQLSSAVDDLATQGVRGTGMRGRLGKVKSDFNKNIAPILGAWEQQKADIAAWNEMSAKDRTMMWANDPTKRTIDSYIERGNASYLPEGISGNELTRQVAMAAKPFADWIQQTKPQLAKSGVPFEYFTMVQKGMDPNTVAAAMRQDGFTDAEAAQGAAMLRDLRDQVLTSNGVYELFGNDSQNLQRSIEYANQGLYHAIGTKQFGNLGDDYSKSLALMRARKKMEGEQSGPGRPPLLPLGNISINEQDRKDIKHALKSLHKASGKLINDSRPLAEQMEERYKKYIDGDDSYYPKAKEEGVYYEASESNNESPYIRTSSWVPMTLEEYTQDYFNQIKNKLSIPIQSDNLYDFEKELDSYMNGAAVVQKGYEVSASQHKAEHNYLIERTLKLAQDGLITDKEGKAIKETELLDSDGNFDKNHLYFHVDPGKGNKPDEILLYKPATKGKNREYYHLPISSVDARLDEPIQAANAALATSEEEIQNRAAESYRIAGGYDLSDHEFYMKNNMSKQEYQKAALRDAIYYNSESAANAVSAIHIIGSAQGKPYDVDYTKLDPKTKK